MLDEFDEPFSFFLNRAIFFKKPTVPDITDAASGLSGRRVVACASLPMAVAGLCATRRCDF